MDLPDTQLISDETVGVVRRYRTDADEVIRAALRQARAALTEWDLQPVRPLSGGAMSVVVLCTDLGGALVVLKVPLWGGARAEASALRWISGAPEVRAVSEAALLLGYVEGVGVGGGDGDSVAEALACVSSLWGAGVGDFAQWGPHLHALLAEYATRAIERSPVPGIVDLAHALLSKERELAHVSGVVPSHGDLLAKNILRAGDGVVVIDPLAIWAPRPFDAARAVASVLAAGGDHRPVLEASAELGVGDFGPWMNVAVLVAAAGTASIDSVDTGERLLTLLG